MELSVFELKQLYNIQKTSEYYLIKSHLFGWVQEGLQTPTLPGFENKELDYRNKGTKV